MSIPTIDELETELLDLIKVLPAFRNQGFSVFDAGDLDAQRGRETLPVVGVAYEGCENLQLENSNVSRGAQSATMLTMEFVVILAIQYEFNGGSNASRQQAHNLLDETRRAVMGYKGVNARAWRFVGERPLPTASGDGVVFYAQVWQTSLPSIGTFNQPF